MVKDQNVLIKKLCPICYIDHKLELKNNFWKFIITVGLEDFFNHVGFYLINLLILIILKLNIICNY